MRSISRSAFGAWLVALVTSWVGACGDNAAVPALRIETPLMQLGPAEEKTTCSYHQLPADLPPVARLAIYGDAVVHDVIVELVAGPVPDGEVSELCARDPGAAIVLSTKRQQATVDFPEDAPLQLTAGLGLIVRTHYLNPDDHAGQGYVRVTLHPSLEAQPASSLGLVSGTRTDFRVPLGASQVEATCELPAGTSAWGGYLVAHHRAYRLTLRRDPELVAQTFDWLHPGFVTVPAGTSRLTQTCEYINTSGAIIMGGPNYADQERCGFVGFVRGARGLTRCLVP